MKILIGQVKRNAKNMCPGKTLFMLMNNMYCFFHCFRFPEWGQLPTVYLPPENKGYDVERIINEDIDLDPGTPHHLPWFPPLCDTTLLDSIKLPTKYSNMPGLKTPSTKEKYPDESIRIKFLESFGQKEENENIAELGARIKSAMEAEIWPSWLLHTLAANYWRIIGNQKRKTNL